MGFGAGFDNTGEKEKNDEIENRIDELQTKARDGIEQSVDNKAYTVNNPSMYGL